MSGDPDVTPTQPEIDTSVAHPARIYDYFLGGKDNYAADRATAERVLEIAPIARQSARRNREFVLRATRVLVGELGIRQIVDVGAGIPTAPTVHEIARSIAPDTVVAYADNDPIVLAHDRALLSGDPGVVTVLADITDPASVVDHPELAGHIDWSRPVGLVIAAVLHFIPDERDPLGLLGAFRARMAPGSAMVLSMATSEGLDAGHTAASTDAYRASQPLSMRSRAGIEAMFAGTELIEPGVTFVSDWRPTAVPPSPTEGGRHLLAGVGLIR